jgi:hypothetical protein
MRLSEGDVVCSAAAATAHAAVRAVEETQPLGGQAGLIYAEPRSPATTSAYSPRMTGNMT